MSEDPDQYRAIARDEFRPDVERFLAAVMVLEAEGRGLDGPRVRRFLGWQPGRVYAAMQQARRRGWITYDTVPPI